VAEAADGREAVALAAAEEPDVVVMDIAMPHLNGVEAARQIVAHNPHVAVAILSMHSDESYVIRSLKAGARAYLLKDSGRGGLDRGHPRHPRREELFQPAVTRILKEDYVRQLGKMDADDTYELLTNREREVLQLVPRAEQQRRRQLPQLEPVYGGDSPHPHSAKMNLHSVPN